MRLDSFQKIGLENNAICITTNTEAPYLFGMDLVVILFYGVATTSCLD